MCFCGGPRQGDAPHAAVIRSWVLGDTPGVAHRRTEAGLQRGVFSLSMFFRRRRHGGGGPMVSSCCWRTWCLELGKPTGPSEGLPTDPPPGWSTRRHLAGSIARFSWTLCARRPLPPASWARLCGFAGLLLAQVSDDTMQVPAVPDGSWLRCCPAIDVVEALSHCIGLGRRHWGRYHTQTHKQEAHTRVRGPRAGRVCAGHSQQWSDSIRVLMSCSALVRLFRACAQAGSLRALRKCRDSLRRPRIHGPMYESTRWVQRASDDEDWRRHGITCSLGFHLRGSIRHLGRRRTPAS